MANYYATARSNYFGVKNEDAFRQWVDQLGLKSWSHLIAKRWRTGSAGSRFPPGDHADNGGLPDSLYDEETDEVHDVNVQEQLAAHFVDDEVAVLIQVGSEKLRYVDGSAVALNSRGESVSIDLWDIYELARTLGSKLTRAEFRPVLPALPRPTRGTVPHNHGAAPFTFPISRSSGDNPQTTNHQIDSPMDSTNTATLFCRKGRAS